MKTKIFHSNAWNEFKTQFFVLSPAPSTSHFQAVSFPYRAETIRSRDWSICKPCQMTSPRLSSLCKKRNKNYTERCGGFIKCRLKSPSSSVQKSSQSAQRIPRPKGHGVEAGKPLGPFRKTSGRHMTKRVF